jgi:3-methylcrotonyl-CoA carboxylase alpha subunit
MDHLRLPDGVRVDSGVEAGDWVSPHYDAMLAKLIAHGSTRRVAAATLSGACAAVQVWPVRTNAAFLARTLADPDFVGGDIDTGFIERHAARIVPTAEPSAEVLQAAAQAVAAADEAGGPWEQLTGFRMAAAPERRVRVEVAGLSHLVEVGQSLGHASHCTVSGERVLFLDGEAWSIGTLRGADVARHHSGDGTIVSPMPGRIVALNVTHGARVQRGQRLLVLEAMKLEHNLLAPFDGVVAELRTGEGQQVVEGALLLRIETLS